MRSSAPKVFRIQTEADLERIPFVNGMAAVEIPAHLLDKLELKHAERGDSPRLRALEKSIRDRGFQPIEPITARIGRRGRWIVINGGHRITAARHVMREFWTNLFGDKVQTFYFILFTNPESWSKVPPPSGVEIDREVHPEDSELREQWSRASARMNEVRAPPRR
ncbi:MAG: ParB N-terminal domain-containing protein [Rhodobacteraceae bacterium]|nr:ParB N-terminal domain-containing protein [Paracoccaceae bacterium]